MKYYVENEKHDDKKKKKKKDKEKNVVTKKDYGLTENAKVIME